jgi:L-ascorbate metabolism protein UlaG (beta-lactamase superfamily)
MRFRLVRHATLVVQYSEHRILVDPMLDDAGARPPIQNSPNPRNNPLVPLPTTAEEVLQGIEAVLVTHTHSDHWDATAVRRLPKQIPLFGQAEDEAQFRGHGFTQVHSVKQTPNWNGIEISRTSGQHGRGELAKAMAPVSGFVLRAAGEPALYIAGDTIWCDDVQQTLRGYQPAVVVVNTGAAQFLEGDPPTT